MISTNKDIVNKECEGENTKFVIVYHTHIIFVFVGHIDKLKLMEVSWLYTFVCMYDDLKCCVIAD